MELCKEGGAGEDIYMQI